MALGTVYFSGMAAAEAAIEPEVTRIVNINTASMTELLQLPGIGLVRANEIMAYRELHPFTDPEELLRVEGISPRIFRLLVKHVTVDGPTYLKV